MGKQRELPADPLMHASAEAGEDMPTRLANSNHGVYYSLDERAAMGALHGHRPETAIQALMETAPHDEPVTSMEELADLREVLCDALDKLDDQQRWIVDACVSGRTSLRELGTEINLSKTHIARLRDAAFAQLAELLENNPLVIEHLLGNHSLGDDE